MHTSLSISWAVLAWDVFSGQRWVGKAALLMLAWISHVSGDKLTVGWSSIVLNGMDSPPRDFSSSSTRAGLVHTKMAAFSSVQSLNRARLFATTWTDGRVAREKWHTMPFEAKAWRCVTLSTFYTAKPVTGFPGSTRGKGSTCQAGDARDAGSVLGSGRSPGEGNGNSLQYSCLEPGRLQSTGSQRVRHD